MSEARKKNASLEKQFAETQKKMTELATNVKEQRAMEHRRKKEIDLEAYQAKKKIDADEKERAEQKKVEAKEQRWKGLAHGDGGFNLQFGGAALK